MVLTRAQAAKQKASQSPQPSPPKVTKQPRKQRSRSGSGSAGEHPPAEEAELQQQLEQEEEQEEQQGEQGEQPEKQGKAGKMRGRLARLKTEAAAGGPSSHPLSSLPASPAAAGSPSRGGPFLAPAEQQEQLGGALAAGQTASEQQEAAAQQQQQPEASDGLAAAVSAEARHLQQQRLTDETEAASAAQQEQQQRAQPPAPQPRPEKLLKPLPDKPVPCDKLPDGPEPVQVDVEYVAREDLQPVEDPGAALGTALSGLGSSDWVEVVGTLNVLRQLAAHHPEACTPQLDALVPLVLKSVRSLRSSVCKTAIMAVADLYRTYGDALLPLTDVGGQAKPLGSLLAQILLKCSSNDKKFVIEEAQRTLQIMVASLEPAQLLPLLLPYADTHKNPKVRGKAAGAAAEAVGRMSPADMAAFGLPRLLQVAGKLVTDNTPDARDSAKRMIELLKAAAADPEVAPQLGVEAPPPPPEAAPATGGEGTMEEGEGPALPQQQRRSSQWELFCQAHLKGSAALAVLKTSSTD